MPEQEAAVDQLLHEFGSEGFWAKGAGVPRRGLAAKLAKLGYVQCWLAYADGKPVGLAVCFELFATFKGREFINIHDLVVTSSMRGQGVGTAMLAAIEQEARQSGACKVTLEVEEGNTEAASLYRKNGFSEKRYGPEAGSSYYMSKHLD